MAAGEDPGAADRYPSERVMMNKTTDSTTSTLPMVVCSTGHNGGGARTAIVDGEGARLIHLAAARCKVTIHRTDADQSIGLVEGARDIARLARHIRRLARRTGSREALRAAHVLGGAALASLTTVPTHATLHSMLDDELIPCHHGQGHALFMR